MGLTCLSHTKNCTVKNALLWGMCRSHFYQVRVQSQLNSRIVHLVLAVLEAIPVAGQIISLIELKLIRQYTRTELKIIRPQARPQPTSCIPTFATDIYQENPSDIRRVWPADLKLLGLTTAQMKEVDGHVRDAFRAGDMTFSKKKLLYKNGTVLVDAVLPISLSCFRKKIDLSFCVLLFPKTVFASGGERKIRWAYDLTKGTFLLKKRITGLFEKQLLNYLIPLRAQRGIQTTITWRDLTDKQNKTKEQIIEPVRDGTLTTLLGTAPLANFNVKYELIMDLLDDLNDLHHARLSGVTINTVTPPQELSYTAFHTDIKPLNILTSFQNGKWRAELCDFGVATAHPVSFCISTGFTPPEYIRFYKKERPLGIQKNWFGISDLQIAHFNIKHGQGRDVWSMGLSILTLIVEREEQVMFENVLENTIGKFTIPPLPCLKAILSGKIWDHYDEEGILRLKQQTVNEDLDQLEKEITPKHPEERRKLAKLFEMLKTMMLRIDPNERKSIAQCIAFLQDETQ